MATGFNVLQSIDAGAPALNDAAGSMIAVLDSLLRVSDPDGWEKVFYDAGNNKAVYRPRAGNRFYLRVDDNYGQTVRVRAFRSMSDIDTGSGPFPSVTQRAAENSIWRKANVAGARWYVGACTDRALIVAMKYGNNNWEQDIVLFGDLVDTDPTDVAATVIRSRYVTSNYQYNFSSDVPTSSGGLDLRTWKASGISDVGHPDIFIASSADGLSDSLLAAGGGYNAATGVGYPNGIGGIVHYDYLVGRSGSTEATDSTGSPLAYAGRFPMLRVCPLGALNLSVINAAGDYFTDTRRAPSARFALVATLLQNANISSRSWYAIEVSNTDPGAP